MNGQDKVAHDFVRQSCGWEESFQCRVPQQFTVLVEQLVLIVRKGISERGSCLGTRTGPARSNKPTQGPGDLLFGTEP
jgi:hypothetical protein